MIEDVMAPTEWLLIAIVGLMWISMAQLKAVLLEIRDILKEIRGNGRIRW